VCALVSIALITIAMLIHLVVLIFNTLIFLFYLPNYCSVDDGEAMVEEYLHRENTTHMGNGHVLGPAMGGLSWLFMWIFTIFLTCQCVTSAILAT